MNAIANSSIIGQRFGVASRFTCLRCGGRGWLLKRWAKRSRTTAANLEIFPQGWPELCSECHGRGSFTRTRLAKMLREWPDTLERIELGRSRGETCDRILAKLARYANGLGVEL